MFCPVNVGIAGLFRPICEGCKVLSQATVRPRIVRRWRNWWLAPEQQYWDWVVKYPGKNEEVFRHWWVAVDFALHVCRDTRLMKDVINGRLSGTS